MLPKNYRLTKNKDFVRVAKLGKSVFSGEIGIKWIENNLIHSRFGLAVSLKIDKRAVVRNAIKRKLRSVLRRNLSKIENGFDFLILVRPEIKDLDYNEIEKKLLSLFKKGQLRIKNNG